ncbi:MAG: hypothetical protein KZQ64_14395 [gamma proteobacterium symbiont of Bathyaustriella thionipta]|nr:hypothetical protein [gamma proteobacterium symbiont of Bathyaustriella thionipta]MCU7954561.1 hypothetical protein [gamma proteobacterium symbiont of Bathyaustriella thionipta]MCU7957193.1 hypothetical protein [gamma proteobacterium symbiont of Bathyaustriella thionipta]
MNYKNSSYKQPSSLNCHRPGLDARQMDERYQYVYYCYSSEAVRNIDYLMVEQGFVDNSYDLMNRAAQALLDFISRKYSKIDHITIVCGAGNNAGDGYVLARLAKMREQEPKLKVRLISIIDPQHLSGDAHQAYLDWIECGGAIDSMADAHFPATDLIVEAVELLQKHLF